MQTALDRYPEFYNHRDPQKGAGPKAGYLARSSNPGEANVTSDVALEVSTPIRYGTT
jgi:hypothetical protein